jgi:hypothetical protein
VRDVEKEFLSPEYAKEQPVASFNERFACSQVAERIEDEFGIGTNEQCDLLGKPRPIDVYRKGKAQ